VTEYDVVIAGAGIAGISAAFHLTRAGFERVLLCDPRSPLSLTSDKSTECYRNWWPGPGTAMVDLMNRSVDLMDAHDDESSGAFNLSRRGYLFVTSDPHRLQSMVASAHTIAGLGAGDVRQHDDDTGTYTPASERSRGGADVFLTQTGLRRHFPFLPLGTEGGIHVRRAGWLSAQQYGAWMLDRSIDMGLHIRRVAVDAVEVRSDRVVAVRTGPEKIRTRHLVNAAGPMLGRVAQLYGERLPVVNELHLKTAFLDHLGAVPRDAPMVIINDPQRLEWSVDERTALESAGRTDLLSEMPASCHARPEGGIDSQWVLGLWEYGARTMEPEWPLPPDDLYTEVVIRGLTRAFPRLEAYRDRLPRAVVDGGYYTKTPENRPLIGPMQTEGTFVVGALSGFGVMAAAAAGELVAKHVTRTNLPGYADAFRVTRYDDPTYLEAMAESDSGQL
jgi:glycine/D-amino acid oxidase-like deaminating enzyme